MIFQLLEVALLLWSWIASWRYMRNAHLLEKVLPFLVSLQRVEGLCQIKWLRGAGQKKKLFFATEMLWEQGHYGQGTGGAF